MGSEDSTDEETFQTEDMFKIMIATDIHLGFAEEDPIRGQDTFDTFEEILQIASKEEVDFILLGGDLFHYTKPSPYCIQKCMELLKKYCLGDKPVSIEFLSDPNINLSQNFNSVVNYEDPNINVSLPVFSIHGNHDDPTGKKHISALDLLSTSGLINYFGRCNSFDQVIIYPILLQKGKSKLALFGLSHIRDERLGRLYKAGKVQMLRPKEGDDWFHLLVLHQNRVARGEKNFLPDNKLPKFLDMAIWGHEHDCRIVPEKQLNGVFISQPGSSVATSLSEGEAISKHVGILKIHGKHFRMSTKELKTVRPFKFGEITLKDVQELCDDNLSSSERTKKIVTDKINTMIESAKRLGRIDKVSSKPLIRLIVKYKNERDVFNTIRFGQLFVDKVANSENIIKFQLNREVKTRKKVQNFDGADEEEEVENGPVLAERVEDLVSQHFMEKEQLKIFPLNLLNEGVKKFVDAGDNAAISDLTEQLIKDMLKMMEKDSPEIEDAENAICGLKGKMEEDDNLVTRILNDPKRKKKAASADALSSDDPPASKTKTSNRGRGASKAKRGRGGRGGGSSSTIDDEDDDVQIIVDSDDEDDVGPLGLGRSTTTGRNNAPRARGGRGGRGRPKK